MPPRILLNPPLLNSATPWATTRAELSELYACPHTGAVTTRTSLLTGFANDPRVHQHTFFGGSSLNTYGYSPRALDEYLSDILAITATGQTKPFIISVTGDASSVAECVSTISDFSRTHSRTVWVEINLSCPNIPSKPPPAYSAAALAEYLELLPAQPTVPVGIKTPPYTYSAQYEALLGVLARFRDTISFVTATNTLGSALHLSSPPSPAVDSPPTYQPTLSSAAGTGIGGLAGEAIHCLSLGNVDTLRRGLDAVGLQDVVVIGVGGVGDTEGMRRMLSVGAGAVGVGTALGRNGVGIFAKILGEPVKEKKLDNNKDGGVYVDSSV